MAKRRGANGTGNMYYDEKRDLYIYRVSVPDERGQLKRKQFAGKTQEAAMDKYRLWDRQGAFLSTDPNIRMAEWCKRWFEQYEPKIEESTAARYKHTLSHIIKEFGHRKVSSMRPADIEQYLERMAQTYSKSLCGKLRTMLGQILRKAEANRLIDKNPVPLADRISYRRLGNKRTSKKDAYTASETAALIAGLPNTRIGHSIRLMLGTGISTQELLGLSTFDITADGSRISIRRAVKLKDGAKMYTGEVKAENRIRDVQVPLTAQPSAKYLRDNASGYIIRGRNPDMPMHPSTFRKFYRSAVSQVKGVRLLTPHCCRHTYISHLQDANTDFAVIQALSGQSTQAATIAYIHPQSPAITAAVDTIEALLVGKNEVVGTQVAHTPENGETKKPR